jgi:hypothetical protein
MPKSLPSAKEASWRRILDEYASSGRSAKEFCKLKVISMRMFYCWRRKIALKDQGVDPLVNARSFLCTHPFGECLQRAILNDGPLRRFMCHV